MSENRGADTGGPVSRELAVRCVADDCDFELQVGVFERETAVDSLFPAIRDWDVCPSCGDTLEEWSPEFTSAAPGRPSDW